MFLIRIVCALAFFLVAPLAQAQEKVPQELVLEILVKDSLVSVNDANATGIYTVLHAKTAKPFRDKFTVEKLQAGFESMRAKKIDLRFVTSMKPVFSPAPLVDPNGKLVLEGEKTGFMEVT